MRIKLILLTVLLALFAGFIGVRYVILNRQSELGTLKIISSPNTTVFVNSTPSGKTPYETDMKVGEYEVKLIPIGEGEAKSTSSWQGKVKINKNSLTYINRELGSSDITSSGEVLGVAKMKEKAKKGEVGEIEVESDPQGAIVSLDNDEKGIASLLLGEVPKGQHELSVYLPGFFRRTVKVNVEEGYRVKAEFKLAIDQSAARERAEAKKKEPTRTPEPQKIQVEIKNTPTGFLRVREEPSSEAIEVAQVKPGDKFELISEDGTWYKIKYEGDKEGWVSSEFASKIEE